jgi:hypothetical protein
MGPSKCAKAAPARAERDPRIEQLPGRLNFSITPPLRALRGHWLERRFGIAPHLAAIVASLAWETRT